MCARMLEPLAQLKLCARPTCAAHVEAMLMRMQLYTCVIPRKRVLYSSATIIVRFVAALVFDVGQGKTRVR
eukprot:7911674-Alexandrium_andersonii.AAC.1